MPAPTDCAYLAGLIDGEGSICISEHGRSDRPGYKRRNIRLQIYNTNAVVLAWLQARFGGTLYCVRSGSLKWKDQYSLTWAEEQIVDVLNSALPYLVIKREQADIALEYQAMKMPASAGRKNGHSQEASEIYQRLFARLRQLNKRGKEDATSQVDGQKSVL